MINKLGKFFSEFLCRIFRMSVFLSRNSEEIFMLYITYIYLMLFLVSYSQNIRTFEKLSHFRGLFYIFRKLRHFRTFIRKFTSKNTKSSVFLGGYFQSRFQGFYFQNIWMNFSVFNGGYFQTILRVSIFKCFLDLKNKLCLFNDK